MCYQTISFTVTHASPIKFVRHSTLCDIQLTFPLGDGRPVSVDQASVEPYPIVVHAGATITLAVTITVLEEIPVGSKIKLNIVKEGLLPFPLPCLDLNGTPIGSW